MFKLALAAKIAGFSGISSGSHYLMVKKVMEELDSRGHEVSLTIQNSLALCSALMSDFYQA